MLADRVFEALNMHCYVRRELPILVGFSGGPDSLTLLHVLHRLGFQLVAAHLDHSLRETSSAEAESVSRLCSTWNIPCIIARLDVKAYASDHRLSIEEAARECRYQFLFEQAHQHQVQAVAIAHTGDDQVETVLMHLLRGAGTAGLKGMTYSEVNSNWSQTIPVWRPMLGIWRDEVLAYCRIFALQPLIDESNADVTFYRNRLRHVLLPELATYNPQIKQVLWRMADVMQEDDALMKNLTDQTWQDVTKMVSVDIVQLNQEKFNSLALGLKRRILRQAIDHLRPGLRDIGWDVVERALLALSSTQGSGRIDLAGGLDLAWGSSLLSVLEHGAHLPPGDVPQVVEKRDHALAPNESVALQNGWQLNAELLSLADYEQVTSDLRNSPDHAWLNASSVSFPLKVRARQPGDRWKPLGLGGHRQKLSDMFINEKIPVPARDGWPLVFSDREIIWVPGVRPSETSKLHGFESEVLHLHLFKAAQSH